LYEALLRTIVALNVEIAAGDKFMLEAMLKAMANDVKSIARSSEKEEWTVRLQ
jgi:hypothetical protein